MAWRGPGCRKEDRSAGAVVLMSVRWPRAPALAGGRAGALGLAGEKSLGGDSCNLQELSPPCEGSRGDFSRRTVRASKAVGRKIDLKFDLI